MWRNDAVRVSGEVAYNSEILRDAHSLCHRLPVLSTQRFSHEFYNVSRRFAALS